MSLATGTIYRITFKSKRHNLHKNVYTYAHIIYADYLTQRLFMWTYIYIYVERGRERYINILLMNSATYVYECIYIYVCVCS